MLRMTFRERFAQNVQKSIDNGNRRAKKLEKNGKKGLLLPFAILAFFSVVILLLKQPLLEKIGLFAAITFFAVVLCFFLKLERPYQELKILRGERLLRWPVRTRTGHELRVRVLPKYLETVSGFPVLICFVAVFSLGLGLSAVACFRQILFLLFSEEIRWGQILTFIFAMFLDGFFAVVMWRGYFWLRKHTEKKYKLAHKPPKTKVEVNEHPLQIGREYEFWVEQQGNYVNCHLECYMVMIKTESQNVQSGRGSTVVENSRECVNYLVDVMEDDTDIRPGLPMRHKFSVSLDPDDYVASTWYSYSFAAKDQFDWVLRVILISGNNVLVEREFPIVLVD